MNYDEIENTFVLLHRPGIFRLESMKTHRSIFLGSENMLMRILGIRECLLHFTIKHKQIKKDLVQYGPHSFKFFLVAGGEEFADPKIRKQKLLEFKQAWDGLLY